MKHRVLLLAAALAMSLVGAPARSQPTEESAPAPERLELVNLDSFWRCRQVWATRQVRMSDGQLVGARGFKEVDGKWAVDVDPTPRHLPEPPPADWTGVDFDDSDWALSRRPMAVALDDRALACLRTRFRVTNPTTVGPLRLDAAFRGGVVVYLNGEEVGRASMPAGRIDPLTPATDYPAETYTTPDGKLLRREDAKAFAERFAARTRRIEGLEIPARLLRKGVNVLAIEVHRAAQAELQYTGTPTKSGLHPPNHFGKYVWWPMFALEELNLACRAGAPAAPNAGQTGRPAGFSVWNQPIIQELRTDDYVDPSEPLRPMRIVGTAGGVFCGQAAIGCDKDIRGLAATVSDLTSADGSRIAAGAIEVRFARPDSPLKWRDVPGVFDTLEPFARETIPADKAAGGANGAVWLIVRPPADAKARIYTGRLTVSAEGCPPVHVPVELKLAGWRMPQPSQFTTHLGLVQSPDSVAKQYGVEMWSPRHWQLIERSFKLLGELGAKELYLPLIARTHFGNEHSMVRWIQKPGGGWDHDFSLVEKYVGLAARHLGASPVTGLYVWEPDKVGGHFSHNDQLGDRRLIVTVQDPASGKLESQDGPQWGTQECQDFLRPAVEGVMKILRKHSLEKSAMWALCNDFEPSEDALADLDAVAKGLPWIVHSHPCWQSLRGRPVGLAGSVWGIQGLSDPDDKLFGHSTRAYGWRTPIRITAFGRNDLQIDWAPLVGYRLFPEQWTLSRGKYINKQWTGTDGVSRLGGDLWYVVKDRRGGTQSLAGQFSYWGGLDLQRYGVPYVLGPGRDGAEPTARFEMLRLATQLNEARIFIERALTTPEERERLGEELAARAQAAIDSRVRAILATHYAYGSARDIGWFIGSGWQDRDGELFNLAAEVAGKLE